MTYAPIQGKCPVCHQDSANTAFQEGAASRDAEVTQQSDNYARALVLVNQRDRDIHYLKEERDQLRAELTAALAACKAKDEALHWIASQKASGSIQCKATEALAIQPDDSALKAWLGKPVSYLYKHSSAFGDGEFWSHRQNHNGVTAVESKALYSPTLPLGETKMTTHDEDKIIAQQARIERLTNFIKYAQVSSGVCCCGDSMEGHPSPMTCGHSPVDMWDHAVGELLDAPSDTSTPEQSLAASELRKERDALQADNAELVAVLELLSKYIAYNGDDWVQRTALEALAKVRKP